MSKIKLSKIKPNANNPRSIKGERFEKLVQSIKDFPEMMAKRPLVCVTDQDGLIYPLGGNMRLQALIELKYKEIPSEWVSMADEWPEEKRRAFVIKDNLNFGEWDYDVLANTWDVNELEDWGMDMPSYDISNEDLSEDFSLPAGDKGDLEQITFTLSSLQAEEIKEALAAMKRTEKFKFYEEDSTNENGNGNAISLIVEQWSQTNS